LSLRLKKIVLSNSQTLNNVIRKEIIFRTLISETLGGSSRVGTDLQKKPWKSLLKIKDPVGTQMFFCSPEIQIGNGRNTPFWEAKWLQGATPKDLAPNLYNIARYKSRTVHKELERSNWIINLRNINNSSQLEEFTILFMAIVDVTLTDEEETIKWKWTADGKSSASSAYEYQFLGSFTNLPAASIWNARAESKYKSFAWLVLHDRVLTADNIVKKNWSCNSLCNFCFCFNETTSHILTECNYTEAVWNRYVKMLGLPNYGVMGGVTGGPLQWVQHLCRSGTMKEKKEKA
jgi:hypothetical protein